MLLSELLRCLPHASLDRPTERVPVGAVVQSSQRVRAGDVFVAIRGNRHDGHDFAPEAAGRGALAVVAERPFSFDRTLSVIVPDSREAFAQLCATQAGHPTRRLGLTAVTGTNGKTTTAYLLDHIFRTAAIPAGIIGSVEVRYGDGAGRVSAPSSMTTPDADALQNAFRDMADAGVKECVIEASSHALAMHRMAGSELDVAIFTNLQRDHLDYHGSMGDYFAAKRKLFQLLDQSAKRKTAAVINADDPWGRLLLGERRGERLSYGIERADVSGAGNQLQVDVRGRLRPGRRAVRMEIETPAGAFRVDFPLMGKCNAYNALAATSAGLAKGIPLDVIRAGLATAPPVPGRFQRIEGSAGFDVYVDFAHNPAGLEALLQATRAWAQAKRDGDGDAGPGRILLVFGCKGNDSDASKRRFMGSVAARWSDEVIVTSDNCYDEDPWTIAKQILTGMKDGPATADVILNRREAIAAALARARPGDTLLVAGKGHERTQVGAEGAVVFDDVAVVREELDRLEGSVATHGSQKAPVTP